MRILRMLLSLSLLSVLGACAFGDRSVLLEYPPEKEKAGSMAAMAAIEPASGGERQKLVISLFDDLRADKATVGEVRNGFGMKTADANTRSDVPDWIREAARYEFERAGFDVSFADESGSGDPVLDGQIITVFCKAMFGYEGEVSLIATLERGGETLLDNRYSGEGSVGMNWAATGKSYGQSLTLALQDAMGSLVGDVKQALRNSAESTVPESP